MNEEENIPAKKPAVRSEHLAKKVEEVSLSISAESETVSEQISDQQSATANVLSTEPVISQPQPSDSKPQTETMEVHHHPHIHSEKKWKEYLFQFLMLFLAVFCGFLAEYQLEHVIENNREKQFMRSMVEDLEKDIAGIELEYARILQQHAALDSLVKIIQGGSMEQPQVRKLYELQRRFLRPISLVLVNRTELQLKNAGGMRLLRKKTIADSLIHYWSMTELLYATKANILRYRERAKDESFTIFNSKYYVEAEVFIHGTFTSEPELLSTSAVALTEFANRVSHMKDLLKYEYKTRLERLTESAKNLIQLINHEYRLK
jgi:hypothetical protein